MTKTTGLYLALAVFVIGGLTGVLIRNSFIKPCEPVTVYVGVPDTIQKRYDDSLINVTHNFQDIVVSLTHQNENLTFQKTMLLEKISALPKDSVRSHIERFRSK